MLLLNILISIPSRLRIAKEALSISSLLLDPLLDSLILLICLVCNLHKLFTTLAFEFVISIKVMLHLDIQEVFGISQLFVIDVLKEVHKLDLVCIGKGILLLHSYVF